MSAEIVQLAAPADLAHSRLRNAVAQIDDDRWALADAVYDAYEHLAWEHDDGEHVGRYELIMHRQGLPSIFAAYCVDEFNLRDGSIYQLKIRGELRQAVDKTPAAAGVDWSRLAPDAVRPITAGVLNQFHADDIGRALAQAQEIASREAAVNPRPGHSTDEAIATAPVTGRHVKKALADTGLVPLKADVDDSEQVTKRRDAKLRRKAERLALDAAELIKERRRKAVVDVIVASIGRLADHAPSLAAIRQALDEVTS